MTGTEVMWAANGIFVLPFMSAELIFVMIGLAIVSGNIIMFFWRRWRMKQDIMYREKVMAGLHYKNRIRQQDDDDSMVNTQP